MEQGPAYHRKTPPSDEYPEGRPSALKEAEEAGVDIGRVRPDFAGLLAWEGFHRLSAGRTAMGGMGGGTHGLPWPWVREWIEANVPREEWAAHDRWIAALDAEYMEWLRKKLEKASRSRPNKKK